MMSDDNVEKAKTVAFGTAKSVRGFFFVSLFFLDHTAGQGIKVDAGLVRSAGESLLATARCCLQVRLSLAGSRVTEGQASSSSVVVFCFPIGLKTHHQVSELHLRNYLSRNESEEQISCPVDLQLSFLCFQPEILDLF